MNVKTARNVSRGRNWILKNARNVIIGWERGPFCTNNVSAMPFADEDCTSVRFSAM